MRYFRRSHLRHGSNAGERRRQHRGGARAIFAAFALVASALTITGLAASPAAAATIIPDTGGYDQIDQGMGAQQDIAGVAIDGTTFAFAWDEPSLTGNNSSDTCTYFQEEDGTVTSICYSVQFDNDGSITSGFPQYTVYDCGTTYGNGKCTGNNPVSAEYSVTCTDPVLVAPYFAQDPDQDLEASCTLAGLNGNDPNDLQYVNTCTKPSASPSSLSNDCIFDPGAPDPGFLQLIKVVTDGSAVPTDFVLSATNGTETVSGAGSTEIQPVSTGDYTLSETSALLDNGTYQLDSISCSTDGGSPVDESDGTVTVGELQTTVCTFTNSEALQAPDIALVKTANPTSVDEPGGSVTFTVDITNNGGAGTIDSLIDDIHGDLATTCVDGVSSPLVGQTIDAGQTLTCTFTASVTGNGGDSETDTVTTVVTNGAGSDTAFDSATVDITDIASSIVVTKTANPTIVPEGGGDVIYTFEVENTSAVDSVTIDSLSDSIYGNLDGQGDCATGATLAPTESYSCSITEFVAGNAGETINNVLTVAGTDDDGDPVGGTDDADVTIGDDPSSISVTKTANPTTVPESGGDVDYTVQVENTSSVDSVTIDTVNDDMFGDVSASCDPALPATIAPGGTITCTFTETVSGQVGTTHTNEATVSGIDDDGNPVSGSDDADVTFSDVPASIQIVKTASPDTVDEPGGDVTFSFMVTNTSTVDDVTIDSLDDTIYGDLTLLGDCATGQTLAPAESYSCSFTAFVAGNAGDSETNEVTVGATDDDGQPVTDDDNATVTVTDVPSSIEVLKSADPTSVPETGGDVTFTVTVENTSAVDTVTIDTVSDNELGDLSAGCDQTLPASLAPGEILTCTKTEFLSGDTDTPHTNVATASGTDDDGNPVDDDDDEEVTFTDVLGSIEVIKTATPTTVDEPGGQVTFSFVVNNTSAVDSVTIDTLNDSVYGDLNTQGDCSVPQTIAAGNSYSCSFSAFVAGGAGDVETNVVTASGIDDDGQPVTDDDDATVTVNDVPSSIEVLKSADPTSVPETGGDVTFTVTVENTSAVDDVTINSVIDDLFGDISGSCSPVVPATLAPGEALTCSFTEFLSGDAADTHTNVVTASGIDDDGNPVEDDDEEDVTFDDVPGSIEVTKTATPDTVDEPGGTVTFTFVVENTSAVDDVTIDTLDDTIYGDLNTQGDCAIGAVLAPTETYTCSITETVTGNAFDTHTNTFTATGTDDDGEPVSDDDTEKVTVENVPSSIETVKSANPTSVPETGADVTFTVTVTNTSTVDSVTIDSLVDDIFGDVSSSCSPVVPATLAPGEALTCSFTEFVSGDAPGSHTDVVTATGNDDDGFQVSDDDDETVDFEDVLPDITVVKTANPTSIPETGGDVTFSFVVTNNSAEAATLDSLVDSDFGDLDGQGNCSVPQPLAASGSAGESYSCEITVNLSGDASGPAHNNMVTATASDDDGNTAEDDDDETVPFDDVLPDISVTKTADPTSVPETGGDVTFTFVVTNDGLEPVTVTSLTDSDFGNLSGQGTCATGASLAAGESYSCEITVNLSGDASGPDHQNTVTAVGSDNDGNDDIDTDDAIVGFDDVLPDVSIVKTANPTSVDEPGGDVEFTIVVTNNSLEEATIDSLTDSAFDLAANCADAIGTILASGATYSCTFTEFVAGNPADGDHENTATVVASDDDGNSDTESDDETVVINDVAPSIIVTKTPDQDVVFAPGETVRFTISVQNTSVSSDPITLTSLVDDVFGDLSAECALPQTLGSGATFSCDIDRLISGDHTNTVTAEGTDDEGTPVSGEASASVDVVDPAISITKTTNGGDGLDILEGSTITWDYVVSNDGDVALENISVSDDQEGAITCPGTTLAAGATMTCSATGTAGSGQYDNIGSVSGSYTDSDGDTATRTDDDPSSYFGATPSVDITKTFAADEVTAGGAGSSFTLVVANDGNVDLDDVSVFDAVDDRLTVTGVSGTAGTDTDSDSDAQTVEWLIASLGAGDSVTITVDFSVGSSVPAVDDLANTATVTDSYTDGSGNSTELTDEDSDTVDIVTDINLSIVKTFSPTDVPQGTAQSFTIEVTNAGPSDAVDVSVTDSVNTSLDVTGVSVTSGAGDCSASIGQEVDCTVQIPAGESVTVTVDYLTAPFLSDVPIYGTDVGDEFRFVFENGSILEGSTDGGPVYLDGVDITAQTTILSSLTRNDLIFDPPGDDPAFEMHLSCSDPFTGGWGQSGGPVEVVDTNWQIAFFTIARYNPQGFLKNCGNVVNPFEVPNTATATGSDSSGTESVADDATVTVEPGITLDRLQTNGKRLTVRLSNYTGEAKPIVDISVTWPNSNGDLTKVRLDDVTTWTGNESPPDTLLDASDSGWIAGTLLTGEGILRLDFTKKSASSGYTIRVNFSDGTFLDISQ